MTEIEKKIKENIKCCACDGSLKRSRSVNGMLLNKLATWAHPTWGNVLVKDKYPEARATAILCDRCIEENRPPKYAVEWDSDYSKVIYHKVEDLEDLPEIRAEDVLAAELRIGR